MFPPVPIFVVEPLREQGIICDETFPRVELTREELLQNLHITLDVMGTLPIPIVSEVADITNAIIYGVQGDFTNAGISLFALIPFLGDKATGARALDAVATHI